MSQGKLVRRCVALVCLLWASPLLAANGQLELSIEDATTGEPLSARIQLTNLKGRKIMPKGMLGVGQRFFYISGSAVLELPAGSYQFTIDRGMEYRPQHGRFEISGGDRDHHTVQLTRFADMLQQRWWAADLRTHDPSGRLALRMDAEELYLAAAFGKAREMHDQVVKRAGPAQPDDLDALPVFQTTVLDARGSAPLLLVDTSDEMTAQLPGLPVGWLTPSWRDERRFCFAGHALAPELPIWLASRALDGIFVLTPEPQNANQLMAAFDEQAREATHVDCRWGQLNERVYFSMLETGLRVAPLAASSSGWTQTLPGSFRTYAHIRSTATTQEWWKSMRRGRLMLTNGPLIIVSVNGKPPGYEFVEEAGGTVNLSIDLTLHTKQKVEYLEIIKNGKVEHNVRLDAWAKANGQLPEVAFNESGWMLVRAVTNERKFYQLAMSGPVFVTIGDRRRISRSAVEFFDRWLRRSFELSDDSQMSSYYRSASRFWQRRLDDANVE